jgi:hypothetical protein
VAEKKTGKRHKECMQAYAMQTQKRLGRLCDANRLRNAHTEPLQAAVALKTSECEALHTNVDVLKAALVRSRDKNRLKRKDVARLKQELEEAQRKRAPTSPTRTTPPASPRSPPVNARSRILPTRQDSLQSSFLATNSNAAAAGSPKKGREKKGKDVAYAPGVVDSPTPLPPTTGKAVADSPSVVAPPPPHVVVPPRPGLSGVAVNPAQIGGNMDLDDGGSVWFSIALLPNGQPAQDRASFRKAWKKALTVYRNGVVKALLTRAVFCTESKCVGPIPTCDTGGNKAHLGQRFLDFVMTSYDALVEASE